MAHVTHFKFLNEDVDTVPATIPDLGTAADFKTFLLDLYTNHEAETVQGKIIFGNTGDGINAPVLQIAARLIQYDGVAPGENIVVFHMVDFSDSLRIAP